MDVIYNVSGHWVYPFMKHFSPIGTVERVRVVMFSDGSYLASIFAIMYFASTVIGYMFFHIGKRVCKGFSLNPYWESYENITNPIGDV